MDRWGRTAWHEAELAGAEVLAERRAENEIRGVWAVTEQGRQVVIAEQSQGELTMATYDTPVHTHKVVLEWEAAEAFARCLGSRSARVGVALRAFFCSPDCYLSDFMDRLDREGIPYSYSSEEGGIISYRPASPTV